VFENGVLRRIFGLKKEKVIGGWRKLHNVEVNKLYFLPDIITMMESRRMRWARYVVRWEKREMHTPFGGKARKKPLG
jgi:hypothetical protein